MKILSFRKRVFVILFFVLVLSGCGVWTDFTTYFNLYYNTSVAFEKAEVEIAKQEKDIFEFREEKIIGPADQNLTKVIEKCSKILQFNAESAYFDDALFMSGKAFYYQQSYTKAIRKFLELLSLEDTDLKLEAELWLGKSHMQKREFEEGLTILDNLKEKALEEDEPEIFDAVMITEISYQIYRENFETAISSCTKLIETTENKELISETYFKLGQLYTTLEDYENALMAFMQVNEFSPSVELEFQSQLQYSKVLSALNKYPESMEILDDLMNEDKFIDYQDQIQLEIGKNYYELGEIEDARNVLMIVDSTYKKSDYSGIADFYLGKLWENKLGVYDSAKAYYKKTTVSKAPEEFKDSAKAKVEALDRYTFLRNEFVVNSKKMIYAIDKERFIEDSTAYENYKVRLDDFLTAKLEEIQSTTTDPNLLLNPRNERRTPAASQLNTQQTDSNSTPFAEQTVADEKKTITPEMLQRVRALLKPEDYPSDLVEVKQPFKSNLSVDSLNSLVAKNGLELGNLFFTELDVPDSAFHYFDYLRENYSNHRIYPNSLFALGSLYLIQKNQTTADSLFRIIYDEYPQSTVYIDAAKMLNLWNEEDHFDPSKDIFLRGEKKYFENQPDSAIAIWKEIVDNHSSSEYAPKVFYSIGYILENDLNLPDSAYSVYSKLTELYAGSEYAKSIRAKVEFFKSTVDTNSVKQTPDTVPTPDKLKNDEDKKIENDELKNLNSPEVKIPEKTDIENIIPKRDSLITAPDSTQTLRRNIRKEPEKAR